MSIEQNGENQSQDAHKIPLKTYPTTDAEIDSQSAEARENVYAFLATVFLQPVSEDLLRYLTDSDFCEDFAEFISREKLSELKEYFETLDADALKPQVVVLKQEFMNLFSVPTGSFVAPFEDIYRGKTNDGQPHRGPLLGVRAIAAKRLYREAGAQMDGMCKELPTHVGVELSFMRFLCESEASSLKEEQNKDNDAVYNPEFPQFSVYQGYQLRFLAEHLTRWFPLLNEEIQTKAKHVFYRSFAQFTQEWLMRDLEMLKHQILTRALQEKQFEDTTIQ